MKFDKRLVWRNMTSNLTSKLAITQIVYETLPYLKGFANHDTVVPKYWAEKPETPLKDYSKEFSEIIEMMESESPRIRHYSKLINIRDEKNIERMVLEMGHKLQRFEPTLCIADTIRSAGIRRKNIEYYIEGEQAPDYVTKIIKEEEREDEKALIRLLKGGDKNLAAMLGISETELKDVLKENFPEVQANIVNMEQFKKEWLRIRPLLKIKNDDATAHLSACATKTKMGFPHMNFYIVTEDKCLTIPTSLSDAVHAKQEEMYKAELERIASVKKTLGKE